MVIGVSAGVGKSTFSRRLGEALGIEVYHLDRYFWKPNWVQATMEEFSQAQRAIVNHQSSWIIEGNYSGSIDIRVEHADTIIYLELPLHICLYRVVKRWLSNIGNTRADMGEGCKEKLDWAFIKFIYTTYYRRKKEMKERFRVYRTKRKVIVLKSRKEIEAYLQSIENQ